MNSNKQMPMVSVICLSYNHAPYLRQALDSILVQEVDFAVEILVGEDCSPDDSREILREYEKKYPERFRMFYRETNMGTTRNLHDLLIHAKGRYIAFLETDDYWNDPQKLKKQVDFLESHSEYIGCAHPCDVVDESGHHMGEFGAKVPQEGMCYTLQHFQCNRLGTQTATLLCRNIFLGKEKHEIIYQAHPMIGDLTIKSILLQQGNLFIMPEHMSAYRKLLSPASTSFSSYAHNKEAENIISTMRLYVKLEEYFNGQINYDSCKQNIVNRYFAEWLRRRPAFTNEGMKYLWGNCNLKIKLHCVLFLLGFPIRKLWVRLSGKNT